MSLAREGKVRLVVGLGAALLLACSAMGCGASDAGIGTTAGAYEELLAARYDDLFPDDRVLTVRMLMDDADWTDMQAQVTAKEYYRADIWIDGELVKDVAVRTKGSSSLTQAASSVSFRAGLKVDFNFFNQARSYHGIKKLCYSNGFSDPTLMKEFLGYEIMASMGIPTPRCCFVDLWVNDTHLGVYTQVEAVDATFVSQRFADANGNLYKPEIAAGRLDWTQEDAEAQTAAGAGSANLTAQGFGSTTTTTTESFNVGGGDLEEIIERLGEDAGWIPGRLDTGAGAESTVTTSTGGVGMFPGAGGRAGFFNNSGEYLVSVGLKTNEEKADYSRLYDLLDVLNSDPAEVSTADLEKVLDVDEVLRFLAASVVLVHLDNYIGMGHNYYLYDDGGTFSIIPWDLNMGFGGFNSGLSEDQILAFYIDEPTSASVDQYPLVEQLIDEPEYLEAYHAYLAELIEGAFSVERMNARVDEIAALLRPYVEKDENVDMQQFEQGLKESAATSSMTGRTWAMGGSFIGLAHFVEERTASIAAQLSGEQPASKGDGSGNGGTVGVGGPGGGFGVPGAGGGQGGNLAPPGGAGGPPGQQRPPGDQQGQMPAMPIDAAPATTTTTATPTTTTTTTGGR